jgi:hypothetical protein
MARTHHKIRLVRNVLIKGEHVDKGTVLEVPVPMAHSLVGDGSAEFHGDSADIVAKEAKGGVKVTDPHVESADPEIRFVSRPAKALKGAKPKPDADPDADADPDKGKSA